MASYPVRMLQWWKMSSLAELGLGYLGLAEGSGQSLAVRSHLDLTSRSRIYWDHLDWCSKVRMKQQSWQEEGGIGGRWEGGRRTEMMMADRPTLTAQVGMIEFPYFWTETWRKIGQKGNALGEVFGMGAVVGSRTL